MMMAGGVAHQAGHQVAAVRSQKKRHHRRKKLLCCKWGDGTGILGGFRMAFRRNSFDGFVAGAVWTELGAMWLGRSVGAVWTEVVVPMEKYLDFSRNDRRASTSIGRVVYTKLKVFFKK